MTAVKQSVTTMPCSRYPMPKSCCSYHREKRKIIKKEGKSGGRCFVVLCATACDTMDLTVELLEDPPARLTGIQDDSMHKGEFL